MRENVDDFGLDPPEALADAINQFKMQGVDLTGLDTSGGVGREEVLESVKLLNQVFFFRGGSDIRVQDSGRRLYLIMTVTIM